MAINYSNGKWCFITQIVQLKPLSVFLPLLCFCGFNAITFCGICHREIWELAMQADADGSWSPEPLGGQHVGLPHLTPSLGKALHQLSAAEPKAGEVS